MNQNTASHYAIDTQTAQSIANYLLSRPIGEALGLWEAFKKGQPINLDAANKQEEQLENAS